MDELDVGQNKMTPSAFITVLQEAKPSAETLRSAGLDDDEIDDIHRSFTATKRIASHPNSDANELEQLLADYDCSSLEIGRVTFLDLPTGCEHGIMIGHHEADPLVILNDGRVVLCDHEESAHQLTCAVDPDHFLDGLAEFVRIVNDRSAWRGKVTEAADICASAAGVAECPTFYRSLCGFL